MENKYMNQLIEKKIIKFKEKIAEYGQHPDPNIKEALQENNINLLRSIIKLELNDPNVSFEKLMAKALFLAEQDLAIFVPFETSKLHSNIEVDKRLWTEEYFLTQKSYLTLNFALERMVHLIDVKRYLQPNEIKKTIVVNTMEHKPMGINKQIESEFDKFKCNPMQWMKENSRKAVGILVLLAILVWCLL
jgi:hypothetical protein